MSAGSGFPSPAAPCTKPGVHREGFSDRSGTAHGSGCTPCYCLSTVTTAGGEKILGNKAAKKLLARGKGKN